ncbi:MAG: PQQ-like beta-propeller repeat protein [Phycisphaerae bacterium]|nr:PQQ-like beta-propeller repeat protein [Phycisphaerae bacterium]
MKKMSCLVIIVTSFIAMSCITLLAETGPGYWPKWRGPNDTGSIAAGNPPVSWSETKNIKWKVKFPGKGSSSPIIWGDKIIFQTAVASKAAGENTANKASEARPPQDAPRRSGRRGGGGMSSQVSTEYKFDVVCLNRKTGELLWQRTVTEALPHEGHHRDHGFASFSPVTDGKNIWASFGSRGIHCLDMAGKIIWSKNLVKMRMRAGFGEGNSIALTDKAIIVVSDQEDQSWIHAFNKDNGELLWKNKRDEPTAWATPLAVQVNGKTQIITNATNNVRSYDAQTGDIIWQCTGQTQNVIPSPVVGFEKVFCTSGYRGAALQAIELGKTGTLTPSNGISWQATEGTPYVPSPVLYKDKLYICAGNKGVISCYQAQTGTPHFTQQTLEGIQGVYASPVGVADRIYFAGRKGTVVVIKNSDKLEVLATNTLDDGFDASPAIAGDELYLKGNEYLYCIAEK